MKRSAEAVGFTVLLLAGCGGGSTLTKAQYGAKVSNLCLVAADRFRELHLNDTVSDYRHYGRAILRIDSDFLNELRKLKPPAPLWAAAAAFAGVSARFARDEKKAVAAARAGDAAKFRTALAWTHVDTGLTDSLARPIGATGCYIG